MNNSTDKCSKEGVVHASECFFFKDLGTAIKITGKNWLVNLLDAKKITKESSVKLRTLI